MSAFLSRVQTGKRPRPRQTVLYGTHGIGKTTWASQWPKPLFIAFEDGCGDLDVASFRPNDIGDAWGLFIELASPDADHGFDTVVIDSADWMERQIHSRVAAKAGKGSMADFDYGKGFDKAAEAFGKALAALTAIRDAGIQVVILAHCDICQVREPGSDVYDKYTPKLHKKAAAILQEWADEVLFARYKTFTKKEDLGFGKTRGIAIGGTDRVLHCQEAAGWLAKNRLGLPAELPFDFDEYKPFLGL